MPFAPIIPHSEAEYDTIFTVINSFQDVLLQKEMDQGPLCCVYRIAKELQAQNAANFSNIFFGLEAFDMEKVLIACYGKYLQNTGIENVLFEYVKLGPGVVKSAHNGGKYVLEKHAVMIIDEMLQ